MAESSLSITFSDLQEEVGHFLGFAADTTAWTAAQNTTLTRVLKRGLLQFYFPPPLSEEKPSYEWSFMRKTGTISATSGDLDYTLPDDFSNILDGSVTFGVGITNRRLEKVDEPDLRAMQAMDNKSGVPRYYAIRPVAHAPTTGQRWEMLLYPTPDASYTLTYRYVYLPDTITSTNIYPVGGARYSEVILASCLAAAESRQDDNVNGPHFQRFMRLLGSAIRADEQIKESDKQEDK